MNQSNKMKPETERKSQNKEKNLVESRVKPGIRSLSAYSVPSVAASVRLDGNESPFSLPPEVSEKVTAAVKNIDVNRYPDPEANVLREKISEVSNFPQEGILLGNGSDELIGMLITTFSGGTGRVLYPVPTFSMYGISGLALGAEPLEVDLDGGFDIDIERTTELIEQQDPDLIFLASPNNPTGNVFSADRIKEIIRVSRGIVVVDEAYSDFSGYTFLPMIEEHENLVILRTLSKVGFAGLRLGILYGRDGLVHEINKVRYPYNINSLSQGVAEVVLGNHEFVSENIQLIIRERQRVFRTLADMQGIEPYRSDANFILFKAATADSVFEGLIERDILIRNFNKPGRLENCLRVTIGTPEENDRFLDALREILSS
ncbi:MAG: histidinol-phosphate transaminase [Deltaproteobacteria bacterium]